MESVTMWKRPRGIAVVTLLLALQGILEIVFASIALSGGVVPGRRIGEVSLALGLFVFLLAWGVWMLKHWSFWLVILTQLLTLGAAAVDLFGTRMSIGGAVPVVIGNIIIPATLLLLFWRDDSIRALGRL